jgi:transcriptional regulator with XRE-family HTH domain
MGELIQVSQNYYSEIERGKDKIDLEKLQMHCSLNAGIF